MLSKFRQTWKRSIRVLLIKGLANQLDGSGSKSHYVYIISAGVGDAVKIGHSHAPEKRLRDLQTGSVSPLYLSHKWRMRRPLAVAFERRLHGVFAWARRHGEWYGVRIVDAVSVGDALVAGTETDGLRLADLIRQMHEATAEQNRVRGAGCWAPSMAERRARRREMDARLAALDLAYHAARAEALRLGLGLSKSERGISREANLQCSLSISA